MAYLAGATGVAPQIDTFLGSLSTFLQANGWSLWDDIAADEKVFFSTGNGKEAIFVHFYKNGNNLVVLTYQYWDQVGHVGYNRGGSPIDTEISLDDVSAFNYWMWTDGRAIVVVGKVGADYNGSYAGNIDRIHNGEIGILQADVALGASVVCSVDESYTTVWKPGTKVMVLDQSTTTIGAGEIGNEHATVVSSSVGQVTLVLAQAHQAGALIGVDPCPCFINEGAASLDDAATWWATNNLALWSTNSPDGPDSGAILPFGTAANASPDDRTGRFLNQPMYLLKSALGQKEIRGKLAGVFYAPTSSVGAEDTTELSAGVYIALPVGDLGRMMWMPTF